MDLFALGEFIIIDYVLRLFNYSFIILKSKLLVEIFNICQIQLIKITGFSLNTLKDQKILNHFTQAKIY